MLIVSPSFSTTSVNIDSNRSSKKFVLFAITSLRFDLNFSFGSPFLNIERVFWMFDIMIMMGHDGLNKSFVDCARRSSKVSLSVDFSQDTFIRQHLFHFLHHSCSTLLFLFFCLFKCTCLPCLSRLWESMHIFEHWGQRHTWVVDSFSVLTNVPRPMLDFTFCTTLEEVGESFVCWFFLCLVIFFLRW